MSVLDFKEIPKGNSSSGDQDRFELFARDLLSYLGYKVISDPNRGADGGKDIIVDERRIGVGGETAVKWLVSCKHKAHSGQSVTPLDEPNIRDRVESNRCNGFIGIYSTLSSSGLGRLLDGLKEKIEIQIFDNEKIEGLLLPSSSGEIIAKRYFPKSFSMWKIENPRPAEIFTESPSLRCEYCGKELLGSKPQGIIVIWKSRIDDSEIGYPSIEDIYWCCKGYCDDRLSLSRRAAGLLDGWEDIPDIIIPLIFIKWLIIPLNRLKQGQKYSDVAFEKFKDILLNVYPFVARHASEAEKERITSLMGIPSFLGGLGS